MEREKEGIFELQEKPEHKMLFHLAWPVTLSLLIQGLYSLVDSIFLARLGAEVLSAVSLSFVVQNLASSFFVGIATGMNAVISRALGSRDFKTARSAVISGFSIQILFIICFMALGAFCTDFYFITTTENELVIQYGISYLKPILLLSVAMATQITSERLLQSSGMNRYMLYTQLAGTCVNIILDPIMIFGLLGCPSLGVTGAAYATIAGQIFAAILAFLFNIKKNKLLFEGLSRNDFNFQVAVSVIKIGLPTAATSISTSFGNYFINRILISFSAVANATFGIYAKLQSIALMPTQGISAGLVTMYSFFYGQKDIRRIKKTLVVGEILVQLWNTFCFVVFFFFPVLLMKPFSPSAEMIEIGLYCFRIIGITYLASGLMTGLTAFFQATGHSQYTFYVSLARAVFVRVPVAYFLKSFGEINYIWWCWPISEITSDIACLLLFIHCYRKFRAEINIENRAQIVQSLV